MQSTSVPPPDPLKTIITGPVSPSRDSNAAERASELIETDVKRKAEEPLEEKLLSGLNTAESELTPTGWHVIRANALANLQNRKKSV